MIIDDEKSIEIYKLIRSFAYKNCMHLANENNSIKDNFVSVAFEDIYPKVLSSYDENVSKLTTYVYKLLTVGSFSYYLQAKYELSKNMTKSLINTYYKNRNDDGTHNSFLYDKLRTYNTESLTVDFNGVYSFTESTCNEDKDNNAYETIDIADIEAESAFDDIGNEELIRKIAKFVMNLPHYSNMSKNIYLDYIKGFKVIELARKNNCSRQNVSQIIASIQDKVRRKFIVN